MFVCNQDLLVVAVEDIARVAGVGVDPDTSCGRWMVAAVLARHSASPTAARQRSESR